MATAWTWQDAVRRVVRRSRARLIIAIVIVPLPSGLKRLALIHLLGAQIDVSARIGVSIVDSDALEMGPRSRIGHFTVLRGLRRTHLNSGATIGNFNWITASPMFSSESALPDHASFNLGRESAITSRHYIDCGGGVAIGEYTTIAGVRSTILSHQIDLAAGVQSPKTTRIGDYCFVSSNVCVAPGASVPDRSAVAMGAVVVGDLVPTGALFGGVPARVLRENVDSGDYFTRSQGFVGLTSPGPAHNDQRLGGK
jgi:acetyltransferase-like isoleucine patch superfamily enzyme